MAFRLEEFKKTTRKGAADAPAAVHPHQIKPKDKAFAARMEIALRTFDSAVGRRRRDMDAQAMTDFFGDPRLARGIVACLGQYYKYETPEFRHLVGREAALRLHAEELLKPVDVRTRTYAFVNMQGNGFLKEADRAACYGRLGDPFCLTAQQWDTLLHSDAEDNQVLARRGARPVPADVVALYNFHSLDTVLRRASQIVLTGLNLTTGGVAEVRALARALGVTLVFAESGTTATLSENSLAVSGNSVRDGIPRAGRLGRCLLHLVAAYATRTTGGMVEAKLGAKPFRLMLTPELLRVLGMPTVHNPEKPLFRRRFEAGSLLQKDLQKRRVRGESGGWRVKRLPEPVVTAAGILLPDFRLWKEDARVNVLLGESGESHGETTLSLPLGRKTFTAAEILALAETRSHSLFALPETSTLSVPQEVLALCDRAASEGLVKAADARRTLHLLDESPLIEWVRQAADPRVRYIPGVGLCSQAMVSAIRED